VISTFTSFLQTVGCPQPKTAAIPALPFNCVAYCKHKKREGPRGQVRDSENDVRRRRKLGNAGQNEDENEQSDQEEDDVNQARPKYLANLETKEN